jgi:hypothetical protein
LYSKLGLLDGLLQIVLCKAYRALSNQDAKKEPSWCDALLPGQLLYKFESNSIWVLISPSGKTEQREGSEIENRFLYGDRLLTMDEVVSEPEPPSTMPSESRWRRYLFYEKVWSPKAKFQSLFQGSAGCLTIKEGCGNDNGYPIQMVWFSSHSAQAKANGGLKIYQWSHMRLISSINFSKKLLFFTRMNKIK